MKKRILSVFLTAVLCLSYLNVSAEADTVRFYVSPDGNDNAAGTIDEPLKTLQGAKNKVRESGLLKEKNIEVIFRQGYYPFSQTVEFGAKDSGSIDKQITYKAYENEDVFFDGGVAIDVKDAKPVTDQTVISRLNKEVLNNIKAVDLTQYGITEIPEQMRQDSYITNPYSPMRFYINTSEMTLARWPNNNEWVYTGEIIDPGEMHEAGTRSFEGRGGSFVYRDERIENWVTYEDVWLYGRFAADWCPNTTTLESVDKEKNILVCTYNAPYNYGYNKPYYYFNVLEELDSSGEFYIDKNTCILYYYSDNNEEELYVTYTPESLINFQYTQYVNFDGITFQGTRNTAITGDSCKGLTFKNCTIRFCGLQGMNFSSGYDYLVDNCFVYECGSGGISITGGDKLYLKPSGTRIINNHIYNFSQWQQTYSAAVEAMGVYDVVANNEIHSGTHLALSLGTGAIAEYNDIYDLLRVADDSGMIYFYSDCTNIDIHLRNNFIHSSAKRGFILNTGNWGIYLDGFTSGINIYNNIFYDLPGGIHVNGGQRNNIYENLFVNVETGVYSHAFTSHAATDFWNKADAVDYLKGVWKYKYPEIDEYRDDNAYTMFKLNNIENNIYYNVYRNVFGESAVKESPSIERNNIVLKENIFENLDNLDFTMGNKNPIEGFEELDMSKVGRNKRSLEEIEAGLPF